MNTTTFGLDIAKRTFQPYWIEVETGEVVNRQFTKQQLMNSLVGERLDASLWKPAGAPTGGHAKLQRSVTKSYCCTPGSSVHSSRITRPMQASRWTLSLSGV
jgi:hypothetical protein